MRSDERVTVIHLYIQRLTEPPAGIRLSTKGDLSQGDLISMPRTRVFKSGHSQAVRIPAELAYSDTEMDLEITRLGDVITIFPVRNSLKEVVAALRRMPKPARVEKRRSIELPLRRGE
jgi:antitoxin VapB